MNMLFETYIPSPSLSSYISHFAIQENEEAAAYKVLPGTALVVGFQYRGRLTRVDDTEEIKLAPAGITGLQDQYRVFKSTAGIGTVLVFFKETGAAAFFKQPLHELFCQSVSLENFMLRSALLLLEEQLCEAKTGKQRIDIVEAFLLARLIERKPDELVLTAVALIQQHNGDVRIKELAAKLFTSQSPLEKRFRQAIGCTAKKFASIIRMKYLLQHYQKASPLTAIGYDAGFYDQSHFIKEFKTFTGETPEQFFRSK